MNARLKTSKSKLILDLNLICPSIKLSQSKNSILDNRETKEFFVEFVCARKRKSTDFPDIYFLFWKQLKNHLNLLSTRMPMRKTEALGSIPKSKKITLNRLYSKGRATCGCV